MKDDIFAISKKLKKGAPKNDSDLKGRAAEIIGEFISLVEISRNDYEKLWLYCAKRPILDYHLEKYDNLIRYCREKVEQLNSNVYYNNPFLKSEWLASSEPIQSPAGAFYRKVFSCEEKPNKAKLLAMAGDRCRIYVNGKLIGDVLSRNTISFGPIKESIKVFDVAEFLVRGPNLIAVESLNYQNSISTFNLLMRYELGKENRKENAKGSVRSANVARDVISDVSWMCFNGYETDNPDLKIREVINMPVIAGDWNENPSKDYSVDKAGWKNAKSFGRPPAYNFHIYDEDLLNGAVPFIEYEFGIHDSIMRIAGKKLGPKFSGLIHSLLPLVTRVLNLR